MADRGLKWHEIRGRPGARRSEATRASLCFIPDPMASWLSKGVVESLGIEYKVVGTWSTSALSLTASATRSCESGPPNPHTLHIQGRSIMAIYKRNITVDDRAITSGVQLTLRQSLLPNALGMFASLPSALLAYLSFFTQSLSFSSSGDLAMACLIL